MDGVLVDAKDWHYEALNRALSLFGYHINRYEHLMVYDGLPTRRKLEMLTLERGLPTALHDFINELKQIYTMELIHSRCKPVFQHEYALSRLKAAGYKLAVASNSVRNTVEVIMQKSNLVQYMDLLLSNEDVTRGKPDPEIYQRAIEGLGFLPGECLVVEDNDNGIRSARAAGAQLLVVEAVTDVSLHNIMACIHRYEDKMV